MSRIIDKKAKIGYTDVIKNERTIKEIAPRLRREFIRMAIRGLPQESVMNLNSYKVVGYFIHVFTEGKHEGGTSKRVGPFKDWDKAVDFLVQRRFRQAGGWRCDCQGSIYFGKCATINSLVSPDEMPTI